MNNKKCYGPFQLWVLNNFPFTIDDWDSITQYQMLCKCLGALKEQLDVNSDLYKKISDLENYFNNLNVQEEINNKLDEMAEDGTLEEIVGEYLFYFWVSPKSYGAKLDGTTDDTQAITEALSHGNVKFPSNCEVRLENLDIPNNRIIDFNNATIKSNGTAIKIGSLDDTSYNKKITIKNGSFDVGTNAIELIQSIFIDIENCYLPSLKNGNKFISMTNCFNVYIDKCSVGDYTPSFVTNTKGIYVNSVDNAGIVGTNNTTNLRISNTLIQRVETGIELNVENGLIDTTLIDNVGFSDVDTGILIPNSYIRNTVINCLRSEFSRLVIDNSGRVNINGLESYSNEQCIKNSAQMYLNGNVDLRGEGIGIESTGALYILAPITADNDITFDITYANKPYSVYPVNNNGVPNDFISPILNYNINQTGDFNLSDLTTSGVPIGSELTLNSENGFTINGYNCKYVIPELGSVRLKKLTNWCVEMLGAKVGTAPTVANGITLNNSKVKIIGSQVIFNYDITTSSTIDKNNTTIFSGLPAPTSGGNYIDIKGIGCVVKNDGTIATWYDQDIPAGTYRGTIIYSL